MEIVINTCYGGYGLSVFAVHRYYTLKGVPFFLYQGSYRRKFIKIVDVDNYQNVGNSVWVSFTDLGDEFDQAAGWSKHFFDGDRTIERDDPVLVQVVKELGEKANDNYAYLTVVEIPDDVEWEIDDYDGMETIHEKHRSWS